MGRPNDSEVLLLQFITPQKASAGFAGFLGGLKAFLCETCGKTVKRQQETVDGPTGGYLTLLGFYCSPQCKVERPHRQPLLHPIGEPIRSQILATNYDSALLFAIESFPTQALVGSQTSLYIHTFGMRDAFAAFGVRNKPVCIAYNDIRSIKRGDFVGKNATDVILNHAEAGCQSAQFSLTQEFNADFTEAVDIMRKNHNGNLEVVGFSGEAAVLEPTFPVQHSDLVEMPPNPVVFLLNKNIVPPETMLACVGATNYEYLVLTDKRVILLKTEFAAMTSATDLLVGLTKGQAAKCNSFDFKFIKSIELISDSKGGKVSVLTEGGVAKTHEFSGVLGMAADLAKLTGDNVISFTSAAEPTLRRTVEVAKRLIDGKSQEALPAPSPVSSNRSDIPTQIAQLASLRDAGILTEEEFVSKKTELLKRM